MRQNNVSTIMSRLWQADPTKAKWTILAMAYTEIRDKVGTNRAPLPAFLAITAPLVGLINPNDYVAT